MFWNLANKQGLEEFWKPMYSYKHIFSLGENTSHTVSTQESLLSHVQGGRVK